MVAAVEIDCTFRSHENAISLTRNRLLGFRAPFHFYSRTVAVAKQSPFVTLRPHHDYNHEI